MQRSHASVNGLSRVFHSKPTPADLCRGRESKCSCSLVLVLKPCGETLRRRRRAALAPCTVTTTTTTTDVSFRRLIYAVCPEKRDVTRSPSVLSRASKIPTPSLSFASPSNTSYTPPSRSLHRPHLSYLHWLPSLFTLSSINSQKMLRTLQPWMRIANTPSRTVGSTSSIRGRLM